MAKESPTSTNTKKTRRLRATPTFREQTEKKQVEKPRRLRVVFVPFRVVGKGIAKLGSGIKNSSFGKTAGKVGQSKLFAPVRFVGRVLAKILFLSYFKGAWQEIKKVTWPDSRTTWKLTFAVLVFAGVFGALVAGVDWAFEKLFKEVILKA